VINTQSNRIKGRTPGIVNLCRRIFVARYVGNEKYTYFCDYIGYHKRYFDLGSHLIREESALQDEGHP
jgi:hypothetical protein